MCRRVRHRDMKFLQIAVVLCILLIPNFGFSQNSLDPTIQKSKPTQKHYAPKRTRTVTKKKNVKHTAQYEFYNRVELAAKEKQRLLKILSKRQFSDPTYFGHKRKPKRRVPHKMKFCHECHIRH